MKKIAFLALALLFVGGAGAQGTLDKDWSDPATGGGGCPGCFKCERDKWDEWRWACKKTAYGETGNEYCQTDIWGSSCNDWGAFCECIQVQGSLQSGTAVDRLAAFGLLPGAADVEYFRPLGVEAGACL